MTHSRAFTMTELLVVMGSGSVVLLVSTGVLRIAMTHDRASMQRVHDQMVAVRLSTQFRRDVHAAEQVVFRNGEARSSVTLIVAPSEAIRPKQQIIYRVEGPRLHRFASSSVEIASDRHIPEEEVESSIAGSRRGAVIEAAISPNTTPEDRLESDLLSVGLEKGLESYTFSEGTQITIARRSRPDRLELVVRRTRPSPTLAGDSVSTHRQPVTNNIADGRLILLAQPTIGKHVRFNKPGEHILGESSQCMPSSRGQHVANTAQQTGGNPHEQLATGDMSTAPLLPLERIR